MNVPNQKQKSVTVHDFAMNPRSDVPRSVFGMNHGLKTAFSFSYLVPILTEEVLPGDTWKAGISVVARTATPIVPVQDNWHLEFFSFFVPMRLIWPNSRRFWGEQDSPTDPINYTVPTVTSAAGGFPINTIFDYMGLPTVGQVGGGNTVTVNALPLCAMNLIYNQWFRDENLQNWFGPTAFGDGPYSVGNFALLTRGKRFDYITQALPWPQKGGTAISVPLGSSAIVKTQTTEWNTGSNPAGIAIGTTFRRSNGGAAPSTLAGINAGALGEASATGQALTSNVVYPTNLYADLTTATAATIATLRTAITLQQYLEKDARGGTRYTEFVFNHFGVRSPDARLQRPEFIGGGHANILTTAIPQTSATGLTGGTTPAGNLSATGHVSGRTGFTYSATEHGFILTLVSARADITYQQGLRRMWSRSTRYDYPVPLLANLGEQTLYNREVYADGSANDANAFGYIPRWDEYRHIPSRITGLYKSTSAGTLDYWHSSQKFTALPTLNDTFITDDAKTVTQRNFSAGASSANQQILADFYFDMSVARALPAYGIPGLKRL
ncbi:major capsid protein [Blackfly microvirus SF02]|uniref:Major capsid protein n=1 Tax=Blackfly microvirus SF02 TaxID=2576452 RepID=A0A4P8PTC5_9VIRU|nr:major capsid protein [Blackfly microvirus SF02]